MFQKIKKLIIPCKENTYHPDFLEGFSAAIMLVLILLSFAMANIQALLWVSSDWLVSTILPAVIVDLTNEERSSEDLIILKRSDILDAAAKLKAEDMAKNGYFSHYSPTGVSPWYWFDQVAYDFVYAGENLAVHFTDSDKVVEAWMKSPTHKANIMNGQYQEIGVGTAKGEYKGYPTVFVVQLFGTQREKKEEVAGASLTPEQHISVESISEPQQKENEETVTETLVAPATYEEIALTIPLEIEKEVVTEPNVQKGIDETLAPTAVLETVVVQSDLATTSRTGIPAIVSNFSEEDDFGGNSTLFRSATEPALWLRVVYGVLALIVVVALFLSIIIEWKRQHPIQIVYASGLLVVMGLLFYIHTELVSNVSIL